MAISKHSTFLLATPTTGITEAVEAYPTPLMASYARNISYGSNAAKRSQTMTVAKVKRMWLIPTVIPLAETYHCAVGHDALRTPGSKIGEAMYQHRYVLQGIRYSLTVKRRFMHLQCATFLFSRSAMWTASCLHTAVLMSSSVSIMHINSKWHHLVMLSETSSLQTRRELLTMNKHGSDTWNKFRANGSY